MGTTHAAAAGAGLPRRLLGRARDVLGLVLVVVVAWLVWPTSLGGCTTLTIVSGHSMEPTYYTGDLVVSRCGPVAVGDVVVYSPPGVGGARVIHRVIGGDPRGWVVQGDNNDFIDPWEPTADQVLGHAVLRVPGVGVAASLLLSPLTWISLLLVAAALLIWPAREPRDSSEPDRPEEPGEPREPGEPGEPGEARETAAAEAVPAPAASS